MGSTFESDGRRITRHRIPSFTFTLNDLSCSGESQVIYNCGEELPGTKLLRPWQGSRVRRLLQSDGVGRGSRSDAAMYDKLADRKSVV